MPPAKKAAPAKKAVPAAKAKPAPAKAAAKAPVGKAAPAKAAVAAAKQKSGAKAKGAPSSKAVAPPPPVKAAPPVTVTLRQIAAELAEKHGVPRKQAEIMMTDLVAATQQHLSKGEKIRMPGLATIIIQDRPARMGRNPATGEAIEIKASRRVVLRPAKELKAMV